MNPSRNLLLPAILLGFAFLCTASLTEAQEEPLDCRPVVEQLRTNVESAPNHVLTLLEDALIANGGHCVPQFVQTAIEASKADAKTVKQIVFVSITNAQAQAPQIAEAAVAASPKYADAVREAFAEAFEDKNPRLKPADPAELPAWAQENAPVPPPRPIAAAPAPARQEAPVPQPKPAPTPAPVPTPVSTPSTSEAPFMAANDGERWELLHDGVIDQPKPDISNAPPAMVGAQEPTPQSAPPSVEPELPDMKKKRFGFLVPKLPSLPPLPDADEPVDLMFHSRFSGIPPISSGS